MSYVLQLLSLPSTPSPLYPTHLNPQHTLHTLFPHLSLCPTLLPLLIFLVRRYLQSPFTLSPTPSTWVHLPLSPYHLFPYFITLLHPIIPHLHYTPTSFYIPPGIHSLVRSLLPSTHAVFHSSVPPHSIPPPPPPPCPLTPQ